MKSFVGAGMSDSQRMHEDLIDDAEAPSITVRVFAGRRKLRPLSHPDAPESIIVCRDAQKRI